MSLRKFINADRLPTGLQLQTAMFPYYGSPYLDQTFASGPLIEPGVEWIDENFGNRFMYVRARAALTIGQVVALQLPVTDTVVAAGSTTSVVNINTGALTVNAEVGNYVFFNQLATASVLAIRRIKANAAASLTVAITSSLIGNNQPDADVLTAVPTNGTALSIIRPWNVIVSTASTVPLGVALGTVTDGNFTIIQTGGIAMCQAVGSVSNLVAGDPARPGASGTLTGMPVQVTATALQDLYNQGVVFTAQVAYSGAAALYPFSINTIGG